MNISNVHIIRGLASLLVVIYHAKFALWCGGTEYIEKHGLHTLSDYFLFGIDMLSSCGKQAVICFFILSAFAIKHSFSLKPNIKAFIKIRIIRIYLPFIASILLSACALVFCGKYLSSIHLDSLREYPSRLMTAYGDMNVLAVIKTLFFIPNKEYLGFNFAYWSLLHEALFYIFFLLIYRKLNSSKLIILACLLYSLSFIIHSQALYYQTFFIIGLLAYDFLFLKELKIPLGKKTLWVLLTLGFILTNGLVKLKLDYIADLVCAIAVVNLFYLFMHSSFRAPKVINMLTKQSYTLYLFHLPVLMLLYTLAVYKTGQTVFDNRILYYSGVIIVLIINIPLYYAFEFQSLKIISKYKKHGNN